MSASDSAYNPFVEGGLGAAIVQAQTVEQMAQEQMQTYSLGVGALRAPVCNKDFCQDCSCCLACFPDCCEGGCS